MRAYEATATINAPPERIWAILTDGAAYADWESGVDRVEGRIARARRSPCGPRPTPAAPSRSR